MKSVLSLGALLTLSLFLNGCQTQSGGGETPQAAATQVPEAKAPEPSASVSRSADQADKSNSSQRRAETPAPVAAGNVKVTVPEGNKNYKLGQGPDAVQARLNTVTTLIEKSSGARLISSSRQPEAEAYREEARALRNQAEEAFKKGDHASAHALLGKATQAMFEAVRKADGGATVREKQHVDFDRRKESVKVLLGAYKRISQEKGKGGEGISKVETLMQEATAMHQSGKLEESRAKLDESYITAKVGIEKLRKGDTLVRSLHFATKEEEYHYEVDRNDTHQMLVNMLLKNQSESVRKDAQASVERAQGLRKEAEKQAEGRAYEKAIDTLEQSTKELVQAIRKAGIFIPG
ncbi:MAG: hypothetical protein H7833_15565 [Magnetococcus sp. DMHC-1]